MTLLIDIGAVCECHTDATLEYLHKAISGGPPDDMWLPYDSPFLKRLVETFTQRGLMRLDGFRAELQKWIDGEKHKPSPRSPRPAGAMERWTDAELALVRMYLEAIPPAEYSLDDYMMVVDYLCQRYLGKDDLRTEAQWLSSRAVLMGRVQANMEKLTEKQADVVLAAIPNMEGLTPLQQTVLEFSNARAAENVVSLSDNARHKMRSLIRDHQEGSYLGDRTRGQSLESKLGDAFGDLNRDWRRIALTEAAEAENQAFIASQPHGAKVRRVEMYKGACPFCKKIDGMIFTVVDPSDPDKDPDTQIWVGKTNYGRSASPRRRQGGSLVERQPDEMWQVAAGTQHPNCRGSWVPEITDPVGGDTEFGDWLRETLRKK